MYFFKFYYVVDLLRPTAGVDPYEMSAYTFVFRPFRSYLRS